MVTVDGIVLPSVYVEQTGREEIADMERTATGTLRRDVIAVKRTWYLRTRPITRERRDALLAHLDGILWGFVDFLCDDLAAPIKAKVTLESCERSLDIPGRYEIALRVEEV